jgi:hypothetical protein
MQLTAPAVLAEAQAHSVDGYIIAAIFSLATKARRDDAVLRDPCWMICGNAEDCAGFSTRLESKQWAVTTDVSHRSSHARIHHPLPKQRVVALPNTTPIARARSRGATEHLVPNHDPRIMEIFQREMGSVSMPVWMYLSSLVKRPWSVDIRICLKYEPGDLSSTRIRWCADQCDIRACTY